MPTKFISITKRTAVGFRVLGDQLTGNYKQFACMFKEAMKHPYDCLLCDNCETTPANEQFIGNAFTATEQDPAYFMVPHK